MKENKDILIEITENNGLFREMKISNMGNINESEYIQAILILAQKAADMRGCTVGELLTDAKTVADYTEKESEQITDFTNAFARKAGIK